MIGKNVNAGRLHFDTKIEDVVNESEIIFIAVGTPSDEDGSADLKYVIDVARTIGKSINKYLVVVVKSTVPVGTSKKVKQAIQEELDKRNVEVEFDVASNPEFLKEGDAIDDFMKPDRVVIGVETEKAKAFMTKLYQPILLNNFRVIFMDIPSAEMTKYAANAMLATRISFMNDIANLSELVGADVNMVRRGIGSDTRIGNKFLYPGCGYGGSCFPKDVKALIKTAKDNGYNLRVLNAVEEGGKKVAIWGLSFKPGTDDMREAPSLVLIEQLLNDGCDVTVYDPVAMHECRRIIGDKVNYAKDLYDSVLDAEVIFHVTEWKEFRMPNWEVIKRSMKTNPVMIDGRNVFDQGTLLGFKYFAIGK